MSLRLALMIAYFLIMYNKMCDISCDLDACQSFRSLLSGSFCRTAPSFSSSSFPSSSTSSSSSVESKVPRHLLSSKVATSEVITSKHYSFLWTTMNCLITRQVKFWYFVLHHPSRSHPSQYPERVTKLSVVYETFTKSGNYLIQQC